MQRLGSFRFDPATLTLVRDGEVVRATRKAMELLALLAAAPGDVVPHSVLREALWPEDAVEERNLPQQVYVLRSVLAVDPSVWIENIPRRGYRLAVAAKPSTGPRIAVARLGRWFAGAAALLMLASGGIVVERSGAALPAAAARAYDLGWIQWERRDPASLRTAEKYFRQTVRLAPSNARGYAGLAAVEAIRGNLIEGPAARTEYARARTLARRALALDPRNADAFAVLGLLARLDENDMPGSESFFSRALAFDDENAYAHIWRGITLYDQGRIADALLEFEVGERLDPESKTAAHWLGFTNYDLHRFDAAAEQFRSALDLDPHDAESVLGLIQIDEARRDYASALERLRTPGLALPDDKRVTVIARLDALQGRRAEARRTFARLRAPRDVDPVELAATQLAVGDRLAALATLRRQPAAKRVEITRKLQSDVRFTALRRLALGRGSVLSFN